MTLTTVELGEVCDFLSGFAFKSNLFSSEPVGLPIIRIRDVLSGSSATFYSGDYQPQFIVAKGDILIGMDGEFNRERWKSDPALLNQRVCKAIAKESLLATGYLYHALPMLLKKIEEETPFVTVKHLSVAKLKSAHLPLPPLDEQRRIAAILDKAMQVNELRKKSTSNIDLLKRAIFHDKIINESSESWVPLSEYLNFITSGGRGWSRYYSDTGSRFIRSGDIRANKIIQNDAQYVQPPNNAEAKRTCIHEGDVLLTITGSRIGRVAYARPEDAGSFISQHVAIIRLDSTKANPSFVSFFLSMQDGGQIQIKKSQYGQTKPGLNFEQIRKFAIPKLSLDDQTKVMEKIRATEKILDVHTFQSEKINDALASFTAAAFSPNTQI